MKSRNTILKGSEISLKVISLSDLNTLTDILLDSNVKESYMIPDMDKNDVINFSKRLMDLSNNLDLFIYGIYFNDEIIGLLNQVDLKDLEIEVGYFISSKYWNKGYATIALKLAIDELFRIGYKRVMAAHFENNIASARVMQKCGMRKIEKIEELEYRGILHKCIYYAIDGNNESIIGDNIILRCALENDYLSMLHVWGDPDVYKWMLYTPTTTIPDAIERNKRSMEYQKTHYAYYIAKKDTNEAIGLCAIREYEKGKYEECGIAIAKKYHGLGYGKEVLKLLLDLAFLRLDGESFRYGYFNDNLKSKHLAEHFHFKFNENEEMVRGWDNSKKTIELCILTKEEYLKEEGF